MTSNAVEAIVEYLGAESKNDSLHWECITLETQFSSTIDNQLMQKVKLLGEHK